MVIKISCEPQDANEAATAEQIYIHINQLLTGFPERACLNALTWALVACWIEVYKGEGLQSLLKEVSNMHAIATNRKPVPRKCTMKMGKLKRV